MKKRFIPVLWGIGLILYLVFPGGGSGAMHGELRPQRSASHSSDGGPGGEAPDGEGDVYLPLVLRSAATPAPPGVPRVNLSFFENQVRVVETAVQWFGQVNGAENYADIRAGYNQSELYVHLAIFDRHAWYDTTPTTGTLTEWDAASLFLQSGGQRPEALDANSYQFTGQLNHYQPRPAYQAAYRGSAGSWLLATLPFTTTVGMRGDQFNNNTVDDRGWMITFQIPFASLGMSGPPPQGTVWSLAFRVYDRDDAAGTPIPEKAWPASAQTTSPTTWGEMRFGLPVYTPPPSTDPGTVTIRHRLNGAVVPDAAVGGGTNCGDGLDYWTAWGAANYAYRQDFNVQDQMDVADWPCFSKYYVTFPLGALPAWKVIVSATFTLHEFGGSNPAQAQRSLIQVLTVGEDWSEASLAWNNAPIPLENVSRAWVDPLPGFPGWPGVPFTWDVSLAVAQAYQQGTPLRLALYSADGAYHSGKYFSTSDTGDWNQAARPTLTITYGTPRTP